MARRLHSLPVVALVLAVNWRMPAQQYNFRYLGTEQGLTDLAVRQIFQDRAGFLWVSTEDGVFRYDGDRFRKFGPAEGIPESSGASFGDAPDGSLLAGGNFGLYRLPPNGHRFERVAGVEGSVNWAQGIQAAGNGRTFIGTDRGLVELTEGAEGAFRSRLLPQAPGTSGVRVDAVSVDGDTVWYGCGGRVCRMDKTGTTVYGRERGLPDIVWLVIRTDREGNLWARAKNGGVYVLYRGERLFRRPDTPVSAGAISGVPTLDSNGHILLPSPGDLLIRQDYGWQNVGRPAGLRGAVYAAYEDRQHTLWIGLAGRGLARWAGYHEWTSYTADGGMLNDVVYEILPESDGTLLAGSEGGLMRGKRGAAGSIAWEAVAGVGNVPVHSVRRTAGGDVWIGTETRGAARIDGRSGAVEWFDARRGLSGKAPYTLRFDRQQRLWAATDAGIFLAQPPYRRFQRIEDLPQNRFWAITEGRDGTMWFGGESGLFEYRGEHGEKFHGAGFGHREVLALGTGSDGAIWIGYRFGGGIDRLRVRSTVVEVEKSVQRPGTDGLVYFLECDSSGRVWAGTEHGVDVWDGRHWAHYDSSDGLAWDDCDLNAFAAEADGAVWIGTSGGLSRFEPRAELNAESAPKVVFTRLTAGHGDLLGLARPAFRSGSLIARYSALNTTRENALVFRYRLSPANPDWAETTDRQVEFAELSPGKYQLEVQARDGDGEWRHSGAAFSFEVLAPWYRSWWFAAISCAAPLLIAFGVGWIRIAGAKRRERDLIRIVDERTVDLRRANADLLRLSSVDPLTGLGNRRVFIGALERECRRIETEGCSVSLMLIDIDHFKALNDTRGHQRGDEYLVAVARELGRIARAEADIAARYGGEEFAVILPETSAGEAAAIAERVRGAVAELRLPHPASTAAGVLTVSIGVSTGTAEHPASPEILIGAADQALYRAKGNGRNCVAAADAVCFAQSLANVAKSLEAPVRSQVKVTT